ncbi:MAG: CHAP domain-containing protein [Pseudomonadota bacterium]
MTPLPANANGDGYLQCVPYARQQSGISIYGDAHTWWGQAANRYARGNAPAVGAVLAFRPTGRMRLGHVAAVSAIIDDRTILLDHANWSPINGRRGQIERGVRAIDVSPANDWSEVRVWYAPISDLGTTRYPVHGFIYNAAPGNKPEAIERQAPERIYAVDMAEPDAAPAFRSDPLGDLLGKLDIGQVE